MPAGQGAGRGDSKSVKAAKAREKLRLKQITRTAGDVGKRNQNSKDSKTIRDSKDRAFRRGLVAKQQNRTAGALPEDTKRERGRSKKK